MTNKELINAFFSQSHEYAKSSSMKIIGDKLYSYETALCQRMGDGTYLYNPTRYSVTTSKVQSYIRAMFSKYPWNTITFCSKEVPMGAYDLVRYI